MSDETRGMINAAAFAKMKKGVARAQLRPRRDHQRERSPRRHSKRPGGGAALDVYETEPLPQDFPLRDLPQVIMTPHLGASTEEAQENVGIEVAEAITDYLLHGAVRNAVNLPNLDAKTYAVVKPYLKLGEKLGRLVAQLGPKRNDRIVITYGGARRRNLPTDPITRAGPEGFPGIGGWQGCQSGQRALAGPRARVAG